MRSVYDGEDEPDTSCKVWPEPLVLHGRLGLKLSDGQVVFEHAPFQDCDAPSRTLEAVPIAAGNHTQPPSVAAEHPSCKHPQHPGVHLWEKAVSACVGSQWWAQGPASIHTSSQQQCHSQAYRQRDSAERGQGTSADQLGATQGSVNPTPKSHQHNSSDEDAAAVAELDGLLDSLKEPPVSRAMPLPMAKGHRRAAKYAWVACNGAAKGRVPSEDPVTGDSSAVAPSQEAKHVSILAALHSAKPAGLLDIWREAGQGFHEAHISSSSSSSSTVQISDQQTYTTASFQQTPPVRLLPPSVCRYMRPLHIYDIVCLLHETCCAFLTDNLDIKRE